MTATSMSIPRVGRINLESRLVLCPTCRDAGQKSVVEESFATRSAVGFTRTWDENGVETTSDPNQTTSHYRCSRGHTWAETY